jgi:tetrahydromethanopterin S-methyltransferase subunit G
MLLNYSYIYDIEYVEQQLEMHSQRMKDHQKRPMASQQHTPPDKKKQKLAKTHNSAAKYDNNIIEAKTTVKVLREMARGKSQGEATRAAINEVDAEALVENLLSSNQFAALDEQDDDNISTMANNLEKCIDQLASERQGMESRIEKLEEKVEYLMAKDKQRMEKLALRDIYHAFNEKCLRMVARKLEPPMDTKAFFSSYSIRNIGDLDMVHVFEEPLQRTVDARNKLRIAWEWIREYHGIPRDLFCNVERLAVETLKTKMHFKVSSIYCMMVYNLRDHQEDLFAVHRSWISHVLNKPRVKPKNGELMSHIFNMSWEGPPFLCYIHQRNGCMIFTDGKESTLVVDKVRWFGGTYLRKLQGKCRQFNVQYCMILEFDQYIGRSPPLTIRSAWRECREKFHEGFWELQKKFYSRLETPVPFTPRGSSVRQPPGNDGGGGNRTHKPSIPEWFQRVLEDLLDTSSTGSKMI